MHLQKNHPTGKKMKKDKLGKILLNNPLPLFFLLFVISICIVLEILSLKLINNFFIIPLFIFISESILRLFLYLCYGKNYIYRFIPFFIRDDKKCGFKYKKGANTKEIDFPIYDRFVFPPNIEIPTNKKANYSERIFFSTDLNGLRNTNNNIKKNSKYLKIICSGGSTTAGQGINDNETWPSRLESKLNKKGISAKVFNAGVHGYDSFQELENLKNNLIKLKPNILILHQGWNEEFEFSALGAGKRFRPNHARRYFEKWYFFSNNIPYFPRKLLVFTLLLRYFRRLICLKNNMSFSNKARWKVLLDDRYLKNWYDNIWEISKVCKKNNIRLFLTNYPCLVDLNDKSDDREVYTTNSRLNYKFANYQAFSKARINEFFKIISENLYVLDGLKFSKDIKGEDRLSLFSDEIHLTAKGEELLADSICFDIQKYLKSSLEFNNNYKDFSKKIYLEKREKIGINTKILNINIRKFIESKLEVNNKKDFEISTDIYTTS